MAAGNPSRSARATRSDGRSRATLRANVPHRKVEPAPSSNRPVGRWTVAGSFPSPRNGYVISFWGDLQLDFLTILETDPSVLSVRCRPEPAKWFDGDRWREHTASFEARTSEGLVHFDVLPDDVAASEGYRSVHAAVKAVLADRGIRYRAVTAGTLRIQPRLDNAREIYRHSGLDVDNENIAKVDLALDGTRRMTAAEVAAASALPFGEALAAVLNLVWRGVLRIDMGKDIGRQSVVWRRP